MPVRKADRLIWPPVILYVVSAHAASLQVGRSDVVILRSDCLAIVLPNV